MQDKRKQLDRLRELKDRLTPQKRQEIQTAGAFFAKRQEEKEAAGPDAEPPWARLLARLSHAERRDTPAGPCVVRRVEIPLDLLTPPAPVDPTAAEADIDSGSADSTDGSPETSSPASFSPATPRARRRARGRQLPRPANYSDVWPDDLPPEDQRVAEDATAFEPNPRDGSAQDEPDTGSRERHPRDWTEPDEPPPPEVDSVEDVPRFRRALARARRESESEPEPESELTFPGEEESAPPITYGCCPGFPPAYATPQRIAQLAVLDDPDSPLPLHRILFLDTETTGLAGGTGTYPFLTGLGFFEGLDTARPVFVVEQYFMEDFCYEEALLSLVGDRLKSFDALCTYNGKTFDVPLLRTRCIFNRRSPSEWDLPHIDLLHFTRRIWKRVLPSVSLKVIERAVLHHFRERDIDGALIPRMYFQFTRGIRPERLAIVFDHNVQDIASLGALLLRLCGYFDSPRHPALTHSGELTGLAMWFESHERKDDAIDCFRRAIGLTADPDEQDRLLSHLGKLYKRLGEWTEAVEIWKRLLPRPIGASLHAAVELAKFYEHRARDAELAHDVVQHAMERLESDQQSRALLGRPDPIDLRKSPAQWLEQLQHRLDRLERRAHKPDPPAAPAPDPPKPDLF